MIAVFLPRLLRTRAAGLTLALATVASGGIVLAGTDEHAAAVNAPAAAAALPTPEGAYRTRRVTDGRIRESSGLARSRRHDGVLWTHNDSGDSPRLFALGWDGSTKATFWLPGASAHDWEALAPGWDPEGRAALYVGDIGDNPGNRAEITVHRVSEPSHLGGGSLPYRSFRLRYEDRAHDAEALLVHPHTGRLYVVTKKRHGAGIYVAPERLSPKGVNTLTRVADAPQGITDGTFLQDGRVVLRDYWRMHVSDGIWAPARSYDLPRLPQAESLAASFSGTGVYVGSEGGQQWVWRIPVP